MQKHVKQEDAKKSGMIHKNFMEIQAIFEGDKNCVVDERRDEKSMREQKREEIQYFISDNDYNFNLCCKTGPGSKGVRINLFSYPYPTLAVKHPQGYTIPVPVSKFLHPTHTRKKYTIYAYWR